MANRSNHFDEKGQARMVDVSEKEPTLREAMAMAVIELGPELMHEVLEGEPAKGDVLGVARLAGIAAVKKTSELIPLAHPLAIHHAEISFSAEDDGARLRIVSRVKAVERTGVEMEAMTAATVAALTVYDMCKGRDKSLRIGPVRLVLKRGGKSGLYVKPADES